MTETRPVTRPLYLVLGVEKTLQKAESIFHDVRAALPGGCDGLLLPTFALVSAYEALLPELDIAFCAGEEEDDGWFQRVAVQVREELASRLPAINDASPKIVKEVVGHSMLLFLEAYVAARRQA